MNGLTGRQSVAVAAAMPGQSCVGRTHRNSNNNLQSPLSFTAATGLSLGLSLCLSVCLSVHLCVHLSLQSTIFHRHDRSVCLCLSVTSVCCLSLLPPVCLSVRLSVCHISPLSFTAATGLSVCHVTYMSSLCWFLQSCMFTGYHLSLSSSVLLALL